MEAIFPLTFLSAECPENGGFNWAQLASFGRARPLFFNDLGGKHLAPKAEVTGSNPVGCAKSFNSLKKNPVRR